MLDRYRRIVEHGWRWLVAADATGVLGYGYYSQFRERSAYRYCVEDSVYVRENVRGQGVGKALVRELVDICTAAGMRQMIAVIGDSENVGSIGVHASLGFQKVGTLHASGIKFGRWLDPGSCSERWAAVTSTFRHDGCRTRCSPVGKGQSWPRAVRTDGRRFAMNRSPAALGHKQFTVLSLNGPSSRRCRPGRASWH